VVGSTMGSRRGCLRCLRIVGDAVRRVSVTALDEQRWLSLHVVQDAEEGDDGCDAVERWYLLERRSDDFAEKRLEAALEA
jgi:hypothetical protein